MLCVREDSLSTSQTDCKQVLLMVVLDMIERDYSVINSFSGKYEFLSNFHETPIYYDGMTYRSVEHAYQAAKTSDLDIRHAIASCRYPGTAKKLGRKIDLRPNWEEQRILVMHQLLSVKFAPGTALAEQLLATGEDILIEGNTWGDTFWGQCDGKGKNWLGELLMRRRDQLRGRVV